MKFSRSKTMLPITLGIAIGFPIFAQTGIQYSEDEITQKKVNFNSEAFNSLKSQQNFLKEIFLKDYFDSHYKMWYKNTFYKSNAKDIVSDESFKAILSMGSSAIPFILSKISDEPTCLVWALNIITGTKISNREKLTVSEACKLWVKDGKKKGQI